LGGRLRDKGLWPPDGYAGGLREFIESKGADELVILRDRNSPAYVAVATVANRTVVEQWIENRSQATTVVPDLDALPRPLLLAFCVHIETNQTVYVRRIPPIRFEVVPPAEIDQDFVVVDERYRRPGLRLTDVSDLSVSDRLDLQRRIATWSKDKNVPIEFFYKAAGRKPSTALERLLAAQPSGLAEKIMIPADIALLLSRQ